MTHHQIERAWSDRLYRASLSDAERNALPDHPSGAVELPDDALADVGGGTGTTDPCIIVGFTFALSCMPNCDTILRGTCGAFSLGCC